MSTDVAVFQEFRGFTGEQEDLLKERLQEANIKQRPGANGRKLKYIKGDYAIATANRIFGLGKWGYKVVARSHEVIEDEKKGKIEYYTADVELMVAGSMFTFPGDGLGVVTAPYTIEMHEKARKEATTDAIKRALRHYGDQFGLSLYDEDNYVEDSGGNPVQVKDVGKQTSNNYQRQAPARVVDAAPASNGHAEPSVKLPTVKELQARCNDLCGAGQWQAVVHKATRIPISDGPILDKDMTIAYRQKTADYLDFVEQQKASVTAGT